MILYILSYSIEIIWGKIVWSENQFKKKRVYA